MQVRNALIAAGSALALSALATSAFAASVSTTANASVTVVSPTAITKTQDLVFGQVVRPSGIDNNTVTLDMTLTSAACPLTDVIEDQTRQALTQGPGGGLVKDFRINWVWLPPWGPDKITDDGREQLRALGFNV